MFGRTADWPLLGEHPLPSCALAARRSDSASGERTRARRSGRSSTRSHVQKTPCQTPLRFTRTSASNALHTHMSGRRVLRAEGTPVPHPQRGESRRRSPSRSGRDRPRLNATSRGVGQGPARLQWSLPSIGGSMELLPAPGRLNVDLPVELEAFVKEVEDPPLALVEGSPKVVELATVRGDSPALIGRSTVDGDRHGSIVDRDLLRLERCSCRLWRSWSNSRARRRPPDSRPGLMARLNRDPFAARGDPFLRRQRLLSPMPPETYSYKMHGN